MKNIGSFTKVGGLNSASTFSSKKGCDHSTKGTLPCPARDLHFKETFGQAILNGNVELIQGLLLTHPNLASIKFEYCIQLTDEGPVLVDDQRKGDLRNMTSIALATWVGQTDLVKLLMEYGFDPSAPYRHVQSRDLYCRRYCSPKQTPLQRSIEEKNMSLLDVLLSGKETSSSVSKGALFSAMAVDLDPTRFEKLYQRVSPSQYMQEELLLLAVFYDRKALIPFLLERGADPGKRIRQFCFDDDTVHLVPNNLSGLVWNQVVKKGDPELLQIFFNHGFSPSLVSKTDNTKYFQGWGHSLLMKTAKHLVASLERSSFPVSSDSSLPSIPVVQQEYPFLKFNVLFNQERIHWASREKYMNLMKFLLEKGASWEYQAGDASTLKSILEKNNEARVYWDELEKFIESSEHSFHQSDNSPRCPEPEWIRFKRKFCHCGLALITRVNAEGETEFLLARSKEGDASNLNAVDQWTLPGGHFKATKDRNLVETAKRVTEMQIKGLPDLKSPRPLDGAEFLSDRCHYRIAVSAFHFAGKEAEDLHSTVQVGDERRGFLEDYRYSSSNIPFSEVRWIKQSELIPSLLDVHSFNQFWGENLSDSMTGYRVKEPHTDRLMPVAHIASSAIAKYRKEERHAYHLKAATYLQLKGPGDLLTAVEKSNMKSVKAFFRAGLTRLPVGENMLLAASKRKCWKILDYLLGSSLVAGSEEIRLLFNLHYRFNPKDVLPEDIALKVWNFALQNHGAVIDKMIDCDISDFCQNALLENHAVMFGVLFQNLSCKERIRSLFIQMVNNLNDTQASLFLDLYDLQEKKCKESPLSKKDLVVDGLNYLHHERVKSKQRNGGDINTEIQDFIALFRFLFKQCEEKSKLRNPIEEIVDLCHFAMNDPGVFPSTQHSCLNLLEEIIPECPCTSTDLHAYMRTCGKVYARKKAAKEAWKSFEKSKSDQTYTGGSLQSDDSRRSLAETAMSETETALEADPVFRILLKVPLFQLKYFLGQSDPLSYPKAIEFFKKLLSQEKSKLHSNFSNSVQENGIFRALRSDEESKMILHHLSKERNEECIKMIFESSTNPYGWERDGNHDDLLREEMDHQDRSGRTALYCAVEEKNHVLMRLLLAAGANPRHSVEGRSIWDCAEKNQDEEAMALLKEYHVNPVPVETIETNQPLKKFTV